MTSPEAGPLGVAPAAQDATRLCVVIPARNEAVDLPACLDSLVTQDVPVRVLVSDNASSDATPEVLAQLVRTRGVGTRRVAAMGASEHFVSCGRWAVESGSEEYLAFLGADDRWEPGFAARAVAALDADPAADMAFPTFVWAGPDERRRIDPPDLSQRNATLRQLRALSLPDSRELANQLYGVFRRESFTALLDAWQACGERYGADYASVLQVLRAARSVPVAAAVGVRSVRSGADLIERIGVKRPVDGGLAAQALTYVRLNLLTNTELGRAWSRSSGRPAWQTVPAVLIVRTPQWLAAIPQQVRRHGAGQSRAGTAAL